MARNLFLTSLLRDEDEKESERSTSGKDAVQMYVEVAQNALNEIAQWDPSAAQTLKSVIDYLVSDSRLKPGEVDQARKLCKEAIEQSNKYQEQNTQLTQQIRDLQKIIEDKNQIIMDYQKYNSKLESDLNTQQNMLQISEQENYSLGLKLQQQIVIQNELQKLRDQAIRRQNELILQSTEQRSLHEQDVKLAGQLKQRIDSQEISEKQLRQALADQNLNLQNSQLNFKREKDRLIQQIDDMNEQYLISDEQKRNLQREFDTVVCEKNKFQQLAFQLQDQYKLVNSQLQIKLKQYEQIQKDFKTYQEDTREKDRVRREKKKQIQLNPNHPGEHDEDSISCESIGVQARTILKHKPDIQSKYDIDIIEADSESFELKIEQIEAEMSVTSQLDIHTNDELNEMNEDDNINNLEEKFRSRFVTKKKYREVDNKQKKFKKKHEKYKAKFVSLETEIQVQLLAVQQEFVQTYMKQLQDLFISQRYVDLEYQQKVEINYVYMMFKNRCSLLEEMSQNIAKTVNIQQVKLLSSITIFKQKIAMEKEFIERANKVLEYLPKNQTVQQYLNDQVQTIVNEAEMHKILVQTVDIFSLKNQKYVQCQCDSIDKFQQTNNEANDAGQQTDEQPGTDRQVQTIMAQYSSECIVNESETHDKTIQNVIPSGKQIQSGEVFNEIVASEKHEVQNILDHVNQDMAMQTDLAFTEIVCEQILIVDDAVQTLEPNQQKVKSNNQEETAHNLTQPLSEHIELCKNSLDILIQPCNNTQQEPAILLNNPKSQSESTQIRRVTIQSQHSPLQSLQMQKRNEPAISIEVQTDEIPITDCKCLYTTKSTQMDAVQYQSIETQCEIDVLSFENNCSIQCKISASLENELKETQFMLRKKNSELKQLQLVVDQLKHDQQIAISNFKNTASTTDAPHAEPITIQFKSQRILDTAMISKEVQTNISIDVINYLLKQANTYQNEKEQLLLVQKQLEKQILDINKTINAEIEKSKICMKQVPDDMITSIFEGDPFAKSTLQLNNALRSVNIGRVIYKSEHNKKAQEIQRVLKLPNTQPKVQTTRLTRSKSAQYSHSKYDSDYQEDNEQHVQQPLNVQQLCTKTISDFGNTANCQKQKPIIQEKQDIDAVDLTPELHRLGNVKNETSPTKIQPQYIQPCYKLATNSFIKLDKPLKIKCISLPHIAQQQTMSIAQYRFENGKLINPFSNVLLLRNMLKNKKLQEQQNKSAKKLITPNEHECRETEITILYDDETPLQVQCSYPFIPMLTEQQPCLLFKTEIDLLEKYQYLNYITTPKFIFANDGTSLEQLQNSKISQNTIYFKSHISFVQIDKQMRMYQIACKFNLFIVENKDGKLFVQLVNKTQIKSIQWLLQIIRLFYYDHKICSQNDVLANLFGQFITSQFQNQTISSKFFCNIYVTLIYWIQHKELATKDQFYEVYTFYMLLEKLDIKYFQLIIAIRSEYQLDKQNPTQYIIQSKDQYIDYVQLASKLQVSQQRQIQFQKYIKQFDQLSVQESIYLRFSVHNQQQIKFICCCITQFYKMNKSVVDSPQIQLLLKKQFKFLSDCVIVQLIQQQKAGLFDVTHYVALATYVNDFEFRCDNIIVSAIKKKKLCDTIIEREASEIMKASDEMKQQVEQLRAKCSIMIADKKPLQALMAANSLYRIIIGCLQNEK